MSNSASYDKGLLDDAPEVTKQQRQRFYDADILYDDANRDLQRTAGDATVSPAGAPVRSNTDIEAGHGRSKEYAPLPPPAVRKTPWYKTRAGIIGLVILAIVIVGAVVGGAVGGTQANKKSTDKAQSLLPPSIAPTGTSSTPLGAPQGQGPTETSTTQESEGVPVSSTSQGAGQGTAPLGTETTPAVPARVTSALETQDGAGVEGAANVIADVANPTQPST